MDARYYGRQEGMQEGIAQGMQAGIAQGRSEGIAKGSYQAKCETAKKLLEIGLSSENIGIATGLSKEVLDNL